MLIFVFEMKTIRLCIFIVFVNFITIGLNAQIMANQSSIYNIDSLRQNFDKTPSFGLYKDNYFIFGIPTSHAPTVKNSNAKFQLSISQRLTKSVLPWDTYLYLFYTQKCFWNIIDDSMPMTDINFNPGIGLTKPLFVKDRFIGKISLILEHESNGKDSINSRSWERISLAANIVVDPNFIVHGKFWVPIVDGKHNKDLLNYAGIFQVGASFSSINQKFGVAFNLTKREGWNLNYNTTIEFSYRFSRKSTQHLFLQFYNGYGEGLFNYKQHSSMIRAGIVIKPNLFSEY